MITLLLLSACTRVPSDVRFALKYAGENGAELQTVLDHYKDSGLKYDAAAYLIGNMPFHLSYDLEGYQEYDSQLDSLFTADLSSEELVDRVNALTSKARIPLVEDIRVITSQFLIDQIDQAFWQWEHSPYLTHLDFHQFCEWVLPYKCLEYQPIQDWRTEYRLDMGPGSLFGAACQIDEFKHNARNGASVANLSVVRLFRENKAKTERMKVLSLFSRKTLFDFPYENCVYRSTTGILNCRANGIPVSMDFTPHWADRNSQHCWNNVLATTRFNENYEAFKGTPGGFHNNDKVLAKVFRYTYKIHPVLKEAFMHGEKLPDSLGQMFFKDVTSEYEPTEDIRIKIHRRLGRYAYLAVFDDVSWTPVDICRLRGNTACFKHVGKGILYLIVAWNNGAPVPLSEPFYLDPKGQTHFFRADTVDLCTLRTSRKYPAFNHIFRIKESLQECFLEASDSPDFKEYEPAAVIPGENLLAGESDIHITRPYRYWRIRTDSDKTSHLAELFFYNQDSVRVQGTILASDSDKGSLVNDGDPLTYCPLEGGNQIVWDFDAPQSLSLLDYVKRGDGNDVFPGDEYEMYYWDKGGWNQIGRKTATRVFVDWENVPSGGLYYIKGLSRGVQNRVFFCDEDEIHWL